MKINPTPKTEPSLPIPQKHKAGFIIVGDVMVNGKPELHTIAPWVEGAFSLDGHKAYTVAKGTIDPHEDVWSAAKREVSEETGIDLDRIRNPHALLREGDAQDFYPGVEIESIVRRPVFNGIAPSNNGIPMKQTLFVIKVKGIENLAPHCKNSEYTSSDQLHVTRTAEQVAQDTNLPDFDALLNCLKTGVWTHKDGTSETLFTPVDLGAALGATHSSSEFGKVFATLDRETRKPINKCLRVIREHMEDHGFVDDQKGLKIGDKHIPLAYYQEGAEVLPYREWIQRMIDYADQNPLYRDVQFNRYVVDKIPGREYAGDQHAVGEIAWQVGRELDAAQNLHDTGRLGVNLPTTIYGSAVREAPHMAAEVKRLMDEARASRSEVGR